MKINDDNYNQINYQAPCRWWDITIFLLGFIIKLKCKIREWQHSNNEVLVTPAVDGYRPIAEVLQSVALASESNLPRAARGRITAANTDRIEFRCDRAGFPPFKEKSRRINSCRMEGATRLGSLSTFVATLGLCKELELVTKSVGPECRKERLARRIHPLEPITPIYLRFCLYFIFFISII